MVGIEVIKKEPFRYNSEWSKWVENFPLNKDSIDAIGDIMKFISNDMARGFYISDVLNSRTVKSNPKEFLDILGSRSDSPPLLWLKGQIMGKFNLEQGIKNQDLITRLAFTMAIAEEDSKKTEESLRELWALRDDMSTHSLIFHMTRLSDKIDFSDIFSQMDGENLLSLVSNLNIKKKISVNGLIELLKKAIGLSEKGASLVWHYLYFNDVSQSEIEELCIETFSKYPIYKLGEVDTFLEKIIKKQDKLAKFLLVNCSGFSLVNEREVWEIIAKAKPSEIIDNFDVLMKKDAGTEKSYREIASILDRVKKSFFISASTDEVMILYKLIHRWLYGKSFLSFNIPSDSILKNYSKTRLLNEINNVLERILSNLVEIDEKIVLSTLAKCPSLSSLIIEKVTNILKNKEYNPIFDPLLRASDSSRWGHEYWKRFLEEVEYYANNFPKVKNGRYSTKSLLKEKIGEEILNRLDTLIPEIIMFNRLHKAKIIEKCEIKLGDSHPEYLVNLNGKKVVLEVKKFDSPEDLRFGGVSVKMESKARRDFKDAFYQTVPLKGRRYPVILLLDRFKSFIGPYTIHNILHGTYAVEIPIDSSKESTWFRVNDYITSKKPLANFIQGVLIFNSDFKEGKICIKGEFIEHAYRNLILDKKDFDLLTESTLN